MSSETTVAIAVCWAQQRSLGLGQSSWEDLDDALAEGLDATNLLKGSKALLSHNAERNMYRLAIFSKSQGTYVANTRLTASSAIVLDLPQGDFADACEVLLLWKDARKGSEFRLGFTDESAGETFYTAVVGAVRKIKGIEKNGISDPSDAKKKSKKSKDPRESGRRSESKSHAEKGSGATASPGSARSRDKTPKAVRPRDGDGDSPKSLDSPKDARPARSRDPVTALKSPSKTDSGRPRHHSYGSATITLSGPKRRPQLKQVSVDSALTSPSQLKARQAAFGVKERKATASIKAGRLPKKKKSVTGHLPGNSSGDTRSASASFDESFSAPGSTMSSPVLSRNPSYSSLPGNARRSESLYSLDELQAMSWAPAELAAIGEIRGTAPTSEPDAPRRSGFKSHSKKFAASPHAPEFQDWASPSWEIGLLQSLPRAVLIDTALLNDHDLVVRELFTTEMRYNEQLKVLVQIERHVLDMRDDSKKPSFLTDDEIRVMFANVQPIYGLSEQFLLELHAICETVVSGSVEPEPGAPPSEDSTYVENELISARMAKTVATAMSKSFAFFKVYKSYCSNYDTAISLFREARRDRQLVADYEMYIQLGLQSSVRQSIETLLVAPVQRLPRYLMLIETLGGKLRKHADSLDVASDPGLIAIASALRGAAKQTAVLSADLSELLSSLNADIGSAALCERLSALLSTQELDETFAALVAPHRNLLWEGEAVPEGDSIPLRAFIFSDILALFGANPANTDARLTLIASSILEGVEGGEELADVAKAEEGDSTSAPITPPRFSMRSFSDGKEFLLRERPDVIRIGKVVPPHEIISRRCRERASEMQDSSWFENVPANDGGSLLPAIESESEESTDGTYFKL